MFERILLVSIPNEKDREIIMRILQVFVAVLNLSNGDMHNFLETRSENWYGFWSLKTSVKNDVFSV